MSHRSVVRFLVIAAAAVAAGGAYSIRVDAQESSAPAAAASSPLAVPITFSGVLFGNFQYSKSPGSENFNKFELERAYLTAIAQAGDKVSIRLTTDVFQQTSAPSDAYYKGWVIRAKYAYLQYDAFRSASGAALLGRVGIVHTVEIDHEENFWPRWIAPTPTDRLGFFSSADGGTAGLLTLPRKLGQLYATITNGPGYASRETDRFKDYAARLSLTPFGALHNSLKALDLTAWYYKGALASKFVNGGAGQLGPVGSGLQRDRWGLFAALENPAFTVTAEMAQRMEQGETGANTAASPRAVVDSTGRVTSGSVYVRPLRLLSAKSASPLGVIFRIDQYKPNIAAAGSSQFVVGGLTWDLSKRASFALDYQEQTAKSGVALPVSKMYYLHWVASF